MNHWKKWENTTPILYKATRIYRYKPNPPLSRTPCPLPEKRPAPPCPIYCRQRRRRIEGLHSRPSACAKPKDWQNKKRKKKNMYTRNQVPGMILKTQKTGKTPQSTKKRKEKRTITRQNKTKKDLPRSKNKEHEIKRSTQKRAKTNKTQQYWK